MKSKNLRLFGCILLVVGLALIAATIGWAASGRNAWALQKSTSTSTQVGPVSLQSTVSVVTVKLAPATLVGGTLGLVCLIAGIIVCSRDSKPPPLPPA